MLRKTRGRLLITARLVLVTGAAVSAVLVLRSPPNERSGTIESWGFVISLVSLLLTLLPWLENIRRSTEARPVDTLTELLAQAVYRQWQGAAVERRLDLAPIPVRWSLSRRRIAGPLDAAVGIPEAPPKFRPLSGQDPITKQDLEAGGGHRELYALYAGLASGRVVVVGAPGAGKSGAAILLLLQALVQRSLLDATQQSRVPVPVLFTTYGWDPRTVSVQNWLRDQLTVTYPINHAEATALVTGRDKVALILDGLDEMGQKLRQAALEALSDTPFRVMLLTRGEEMETATSDKWLVGAVAVELHDVTGVEAADYLQRSLKGPAPSGWTELLTDLREHPKGVSARALSTPLILSLVRDTYQAGDDVGELLDTTRYRNAEAIQKHLIARFLPAVYTPRPGWPVPCYSEDQARQALTFIARKMGKNRDLAWWRIPDWAPTTRHDLATALVLGLPCGLLGGLLLGLRSGFPGWLHGGLIGGFVGGILGWFTGSFRGELGNSAPQRVRIANWRAFIQPEVLKTVAVTGLLGGLAAGLAAGLLTNPEFALMTMLLNGPWAGLLAGLYVVFIVNSASEGSPQGPREIWRNERVAKLVLGLGCGLVLGLVSGLRGGVVFGLWGGLGGGLVLGFVLALISSEIWPVTLAWFELRRRGHVPATSLMSFLEDARHRSVLRTVGAVYQFRHAMLQDHLGEQAVDQLESHHGGPGGQRNPSYLGAREHAGHTSS